jgi:FkbM family methyltransferase
MQQGHPLNFGQDSHLWRLLRALSARWLRRRPFAGSPMRSVPEADGHAGPAFVIGPGGRRIYVDPSDQRAQALIKARGDFNPPTLALWQRLIDERAWTHIVDVGANYGEMLTGVTMPDTRLIAIEPNPHLLPYLTRTLRESGLKIEVIAAAASDAAGTIAMSIDRTWSGMSSVIAGQSQSDGHVIETHTVAATTLSQLIRERAQGVVRPLVKLDVEGHEVAVLRGLEDVLPDLEEFAVLVEILHLGDEDLDWILSRFSLALLDLRQNILVNADVDTAPALRGLLATGSLYRNDAVLRRKTARGEASDQES